MKSSTQLHTNTHTEVYVESERPAFNAREECIGAKKKKNNKEMVVKTKESERNAKKIVITKSDETDVRNDNKAKAAARLG